MTGLLLDRGLPVRAMVRREDDRAAALRAAGADVVVGDLLEPADVHRIVTGCRRLHFGMSVSGRGKTSPVVAADVARVVAAILADPEPHLGRVHELTGSAVAGHAWGRPRVLGRAAP